MSSIAQPTSQLVTANPGCKNHKIAKGTDAQLNIQLVYSGERIQFANCVFLQSLGSHPLNVIPQGRRRRPVCSAVRTLALNVSVWVPQNNTRTSCSSFHNPISSTLTVNTTHMPINYIQDYATPLLRWWWWWLPKGNGLANNWTKYEYPSLLLF